MNNEHISIFERSTPIPFKHANISYDITEQIGIKPQQDLAAAKAVETIEAIEEDIPPLLSNISEINEADEIAEDALLESTKITSAKKKYNQVLHQVVLHMHIQVKLS